MTCRVAELRHMTAELLDKLETSDDRGVRLCDSEAGSKPPPPHRENPQRSNKQRAFRSRIISLIDLFTWPTIYL
jgi:hypothetical protein